MIIERKEGACHPSNPDGGAADGSVKPAASPSDNSATKALTVEGLVDNLDGLSIRRKEFAWSMRVFEPPLDGKPIRWAEVRLSTLMSEELRAIGLEATSCKVTRMRVKIEVLP